MKINLKCLTIGYEANRSVTLKTNLVSTFLSPTRSFVFKEGANLATCSEGKSKEENEERRK